MRESLIDLSDEANDVASDLTADMERLRSLAGAIRRAQEDAVFVRLKIMPKDFGSREFELELSAKDAIPFLQQEKGALTAAIKTSQQKLLEILPRLAEAEL